jgi:hypothetical protein
MMVILQLQLQCVKVQHFWQTDIKHSPHSEFSKLIRYVFIFSLIQKSISRQRIVLTTVCAVFKLPNLKQTAANFFSFRRFDPIPGHDLALQGFAMTLIRHTTLSRTSLNE